MANEIGKFDALTSLTPDADFGVREDGTISWKDYNIIPRPSDEEINNEIKRLQADYDAQDYARKRKAEYPDIYDYMDGIVKNDQTQIDKYIADAQAVKSKYPKGG
jgi:hypothetical protein